MFVREGRDGGIFTMNPSGENLTRLTDGDDYAPSWSPDGTRILFQRFKGVRSFLWVMDADGSNLAPLGKEGFGPSWSPDGTRIAFGDGPRFRLTEIYVVNVDGSGLTQLTDDGRPDAQPTWSPDGSQILYSHGNPHSDLYVMDADGTDQTRLTRNQRQDFAGDWSPDGSTIVFYSNRHRNWDLYTIHPDGTGLQRITHARTVEWTPVWSPDGTRIAYTFSNYRQGVQDIAILTPNDSLTVRYIMGGAYELSPEWRAI